MKVSMIAAVAKNRVIGTGKGGIPWQLPRDSQHFRSYTEGRHMLLGRTTFEEMEGWFHTQTPLVLTRTEDYEPEVGFAVTSVEEAIALAESEGVSELVVSGGAMIYELAMPYVDELVLTLVDAEAVGEVTFPEIGDEWKEVRRRDFPSDEANDHAMSIVRYCRRSPDDC